MSEKIVLTNFGRRRIEYAPGGYFKAGESTEFPVEIAHRLLKLYPDEVKKHGDNLVPFLGDKNEKDFIPETTEQFIARKIKEALKQHEASNAELDEKRKALEAEKIAFEREKEAAATATQDAESTEIADKKSRRSSRSKEEEII